MLQSVIASILQIGSIEVVNLCWFTAVPIPSFVYQYRQWAQWSCGDSWGGRGRERAIAAIDSSFG
jgi:hypothetical protein